MRVLVAVVGIAMALVVALCASALGGAPGPERQALLDGTVRFLQESQRDDGGFAGEGEPGQGTSAWVALALAAAGINPRNQSRPCGVDAYTYLVTHFGGAEGSVATTDLERELLVVNAAGTDPHDFAGTDLAGEILGRQLPDGSFPHAPGGSGQINSTVFAILALAPVEEPAAAAAVRSAAEWLISRQNRDGGWYWQGGVASSEVDITAAAIEALSAAGPPGAPAPRGAHETAVRDGLGFLEAAQLPDGGFPAPFQSESNVASTAWAVQGIWSAGGDPETWRTGSGLATEEPLDYMESMQQPDGHIRWSRSSDANAVWMTAYVAPAFAGQALPIPAATLSSAGSPPCDPEDSGAESGVVAGGGGKGAPLFSRPKPQSQGRTPGGARLVRNRGLPSRNHSLSRRGDNAEQPTGTETAEPGGTETGEDDEVSAVAASAGPGGGGGPGGADVAGGGVAVKGTGGSEVSGVVIGDGGQLAFGAPGLRTAAGASDPTPWVAIGIGAAALLAALGGARWERRPREVLP